MGVQTGPYRNMRHPSYAGAVLSYLAFPFMLDVLWKLIPAVLMAAVTIIRTGVEDRMLREELEGCQANAERTRYWLLPLVWYRGIPVASAESEPRAGLREPRALPFQPEG